MKQALTTRRMMVILLIIIPISACMRVPSGYLSHSDPVLWMYQTSFSDEGTVLYMQEAGGEVRRIAGGVLPGSHREWNGNILFLRDQEELWYAGAGQAPYKLLESIQPYQYGFMDHGRRLYAITDQYELVFKAFGREAQVVGERIVHVLPLEHRLLAQRDDGTILSLDWTGQSHVLVKGAVSLESAGDSRYAIIRRDDGLLVTNGEEIHYSIHSETIGPLTITPNGQAVWYLDEFDIEAGSGVLKMVEAEDSLPIRVAEQVTSYSVQTPEEIWYTTQDDLYVYHTKHQFHRHMIGSVDNIVYIADASMYGEAAVTLADGSLVFLDETGTAHDVELPGPVVWIEVFASGLVCKIEGGAIYYVS